MSAHPRPAAVDLASMSEDEFTAWLEALPVPGLPQSDDEIAASDARARADMAAGRVYPHSLVSEWLMTWGKPGRVSFHNWLANRDG